MSTPAPTRLLLLGVLLMSLAPGGAPAQSQERSQFTPDYDPRASLRAHRPAVPGSRALVTSAHPLASMAGMEILMKGGNAFDAAVAVAATLNLVEPQSSGFGGNGFMTVFDSKTGKVLSLSMAGPAPMGIKAAEMTPELLNRGIKAGIVPGNVGGLLTALERFGTKSVADVLAAAIGYAERGVPINDNLVASIRSTRDYFRSQPTSAAVFLPGGQVPKEGDLFRMPDLARTFRKLVEAEAHALKAGKPRAAAIRAAYDRFYTGDIAKDIADFARGNGGVITEADIASFRAEWQEPLHTTYRGYDVYSNPATSRGGFEVAMQLNLDRVLRSEGDGRRLGSGHARASRGDQGRQGGHLSLGGRSGIVRGAPGGAALEGIRRVTAVADRSGASRSLSRARPAGRCAGLVAGGSGPHPRRALRALLRHHQFLDRRSRGQRGRLHADARRQLRKHGRDGRDRPPPEQRHAPRIHLAVSRQPELRCARPHPDPEQFTGHRLEGRAAEDDSTALLEARPSDRRSSRCS